MKPTFQFRGATVHADVLEMLCSKTVNRTDLLVLIMIDAYVQSGGRGCWASNGHIAAKLNTVKLYVSQSVTKLVKMGLVSRTFDNGQRYLETAWSRVRPFRPAPTPPIGGNYTPPIDPNYTISNTGIKEEGYAAAPPPAPPPQSPTGDMPLFPDMVNNAASDPVLLQLATDMRAALRAAGLLPTRVPKLDKWVVRLRRLRGNVGQEQVTTAVNWVVANAAHMRKSDGRKIPTVTSPDMLSREKTWAWVMDLVAKDAKRLPPADVPEAAKDAIAALLRLRWPGDSKVKLPGVVAASYTNYAAFRSAVLARLKQVKAAEDAKRLRGKTTWSTAELRPRHLLEQVRDALPSPSVFVQTWFERAFARMKTFPNIDWFLVTPRHPDFRAALKLPLDDKTWDRLLEDVK